MLNKPQVSDGGEGWPPPRSLRARVTSVVIQRSPHGDVRGVERVVVSEGETPLRAGLARLGSLSEPETVDDWYVIEQ